MKAARYLLPFQSELLKFLSQCEIMHSRHFGEALRITFGQLNEKNFYAFNPSLDTPTVKRQGTTYLFV
ncbi:hypothetical protein DRA42_12005 [Ethanoligenens harbinense]|nr:hypothetical protein CXQ68_11970 [Ethanoligenens harbinense YUAN-3]AYF39523.1 hypothetical protein CXP51_11865 [Ethanoligenens harbinense]AYF42348.1 hypothetical protein CN246_12415 [Ethanoligenens harbinense]QCN93102.1 hypothetical protein DRA42_12005 [Ethanoligenens harbinense]